jgi:hypothetical protein
MNSSVSVTLDQSDLHTITTVAAVEGSSDRLWLNGKEEKINKRGVTVLKEIRKLAGDRVDPSTGEVLVRKADWGKYGVHISSMNTFPTGAGLASSAAGLACLVYALAQLFSVKETFEGQLSTIARQGSGSASRSLYGGFVRWQKGVKSDGSDSIAVQVTRPIYLKILFFFSSSLLLFFSSSLLLFFSSFLLSFIPSSFLSSSERDICVSATTRSPATTTEPKVLIADFNIRVVGLRVVVVVDLSPSLWWLANPNPNPNPDPEQFPSILPCSNASDTLHPQPHPTTQQPPL